MLTRNFGASSLQVSALGFGAGHIGKVRVPGYSGESEALAWAAGAGVFVERARWENAFAPQAGVWAGEV